MVHIQWLPVARKQFLTESQYEELNIMFNHEIQVLQSFSDPHIINLLKIVGTANNFWHYNWILKWGGHRSPEIGAYWKGNIVLY